MIFNVPGFETRPYHLRRNFDDWGVRSKRLVWVQNCEYAKARLISEKTIKLIIQWFIYRALYCFKLSNLSRLLKHAYLLPKLAFSLTFKIIHGSKEPVRYVAVKNKVCPRPPDWHYKSECHCFLRDKRYLIFRTVVFWVFIQVSWPVAPLYAL